MLELESSRIAFIGSGKMGEAMIKGLLTRKLTAPDGIIASDPVAQRRTQMEATYGVATTDDNGGAVAQADIVVLSVQPQVLARAGDSLAGQIPPDAVVLSIIAGASISTLRRALGHDAIVRCMPNTPAQVGMGVTVWTATPEVSARQREQTALLLGALGLELRVDDEHYLDAATGLTGSGPAFVLLLLEAFIDAGVHVGFARADAQRMVYQLMAGTLQMAQETGLHPAELKNRVTSPAGTTAAGLFELEAAGVRATMIRAVEAAYQRSVALGAAQKQE
ncbi:MAG: pyrroline-5-carboxylate reductase [Litorilinea sp.]